ncbi:hypothetical protein D1AOALGA4SA_1521 [Olavius algarvensis Delta 1 endosymbiont]|nr:hypothetical protein D1AOALGA4SA_1521 [Olavius algarvensis Delta 1 endosymbiont]
MISDFFGQCLAPNAFYLKPYTLYPYFPVPNTQYPIPNPDKPEMKIED